MAYGTIKVDNITFDNGGVDKLITVSGLFYSTSGALTVTGTISGGSVTAPTATFTTLTGTTTAGTTATFTSGSFTSLTGVTTTVTSGVFGLGSAAAPSIAFSGDPNTGIYSPGADQVGISTGGTGRVFVDGSGKVGIGTSATTKLDVAGSGDSELRLQAASDAALIFSETTANKNWKIKPSAGDFYLQYSATAYNSGYSSLVTLTSSGNVGIGVVPSNWNQGTNIDIGAASCIGNNSNLTQISNNRVLTSGANYYKITAAASLYSTGAGQHIWYTAPSGTAGAAISFTQAMTLDVSGRLGIGITSPSVPLQVLNAGTGNNTNNGAITLCRTGTVGSTLYHMYSTAASDEAFAFSVHGGTTFSDTTYTKYLASAGGVHIWYGTTTSAERMRIDSSGNVGIGVSSPQHPVHIDGTSGAVQFRAGVTYAGTGLDIKATENSDVTIDVNDSAKTVARALVFSQAGSERMRIDSSGKVGIGAMPLYPLHVEKSQEDLLALVNTGVSTYRFQVKTDASLAVVQNSTERMRIDSSGNVGIGVVPVSSQGKSLQIATGVFEHEQINTNDLRTNLTSNAISVTPYSNTYKYLATGASATMLQQAAGQFRFYTAPSGTAGNAITFTQAMTLDASGRLGIGTTSPSQRLHVAGGNGSGNTTIGCYGGTSVGDYGLLILGNGSTDKASINVDATDNDLRFDLRGNAGAFKFVSGASYTERARIDSSGRLLVGTSSASVTCRAVFQGHQADSTASTDVYFQNGTAAASVLSGNALGTLSFAASGSRGAYITTVADANWTASSFPAHIQFATVASGSTSPTERLRITNDGVMCHDQPAPATYAAAATLTVADLKTGIITYTGGAATLTLPTGTLTEGGFAGIYTNMTFEWSVINTGAGICTIGAGTAHTIVGSGSVAIGASARFTSRRTAANTFISYRLS